MTVLATAALDRVQRRRSAPPSPRSAAGSAAEGGAGFLLGLLLYGWVLLPFVKGGPKRVRDVWRAKFLNQDAKGGQLK